MSNVTDRFLRYIAIDTQSDEESSTTPSTEKQFILARMLADEMRSIGISNVRMDEAHCYVYGEIPANTEGRIKLGFVSHMDTAAAFPGDATQARIIRDYDGSIITLNDSEDLDPAEYPSLNEYTGQDLIVTDGNSLLGADDKAGIAEIMTMAERLLSDETIKHGRISIAFTPDEEIGRGTDHFDLNHFDADYAYTVDGGGIGELEYENFNAASATVRIHGKDIHPGSAKGLMINAARIAVEFDRMLPQDQRPECTDGYEGFFHLEALNADTSEAEMHYLIRDHDAGSFAAKKDLLQAAAGYINQRYGNVLELKINDSYRNMKECIEPCMFLIDNAKAAFEKCGIEPKLVPVRGGTDGAMLSYMGLPCPNLSTGGHNFHSNKEYIPIQSMQKMVEVLVEIAVCSSC